MTAGWWALFVAAVAGIVMAGGALLGRARVTSAVALVLFTVSAVLALVVGLE